MKVAHSLIAASAWHKQRNVSGLQQRQHEETRGMLLNQTSLVCNRPDWTACPRSLTANTWLHVCFLCTTACPSAGWEKRGRFRTYFKSRSWQLSVINTRVKGHAVHWPSLHVYWDEREPSQTFTAALAHVLLFPLDYGRCLTLQYWISLNASLTDHCQTVFSENTKSLLLGVWRFSGKIRLTAMKRAVKCLGGK